MRNGHRRSRSDVSPESLAGRSRKGDGYTEVSMYVPTARRGRPPLNPVFEPHQDRGPSKGGGRGQQVNGYKQNGHHGTSTATPVPQDYEITTVTISKTKQSLGKQSTSSSCMFHILPAEGDADNYLFQNSSFEQQQLIWEAPRICVGFRICTVLN